MITGIDIDRLDETDKQYYETIEQHIQSVSFDLNCTFEVKFLDINQCHLIMKIGKKTVAWEHITIDGVPYILEALLLQHREKPLDIDQVETLQDARQIEDI